MRWDFHGWCSLTEPALVSAELLPMSCSLRPTDMSQQSGKTSTRISGRDCPKEADDKQPPPANLAAAGQSLDKGLCAERVRLAAAPCRAVALMILVLTSCCHIGLPSLGSKGSIWAVGEEQFGSSDGETVLKSRQYTQRNQRCSSQCSSSP